MALAIAVIADPLSDETEQFQAAVEEARRELRGAERVLLDDVRAVRRTMANDNPVAFAQIHENLKAAGLAKALEPGIDSATLGAALLAPISAD